MASPLPAAGKLSTLWKKFALSTALATTVVAGWSGPAEADVTPQVQAAAPLALSGTGQPVSAPQTTDPPPAVNASPAPTPPPVLSREERARDLLLADARAHFAQISALAETSYSNDLARFEQRLTATVRADSNSLQERVVILDPYRFDAATAIGYQPKEALKVLLDLQHASVAPKKLDEISDHMANFFITRTTDNVYGQNPAAFFNMNPAARLSCVIVPLSNYNQPLLIPGLTMAQRVDFVNRHESWHCVDSKYRVSDDGNSETGSKLSVDQITHDPAALADLSNRFKKEMVADVGAAGDMIRQGDMGLGLIDKIIAWRNTPGDPTHISTPALQGLKSAIQQMGLPAFQALSDAKAADLYFSLTDKYQMSPKAVGFAIVLDNVTPAQRDDMTQQFGQDPDFKKAVALRAIYNQKTPAQLPFGGPLTPEEKRIMAEVRGFDADKLLQDTAFARARKITPASLIAAYATLQEGLMAEMHRQPDNPVLPVLMTKLQDRFVIGVQTLDYLKANRAHGVNLAATEPALRTLGPARPARGVPIASGPSAVRYN